MRFPVVLFDFDGTVIDSGSIILASMRHATKTVLGREIPDEELGRAVGGSGLLEQMRLIAPERVDELVAFLRETCTLEPGDLILTGTPEGVGACPRSKRPGCAGGWVASLAAAGTDVAVRCA